VNLLLDTHALLWWLADDPALATEAREAIADGNNIVAVSSASAWEISIKRALGKLIAPEDLEQQIEANGFVPLPITIADGLAAGQLPPHHDDPFDRMLVAQARTRHLTLVSRDPRFSPYGIELLTA
jgi:PIN domain nuclease of toxin-antitoxin system